jgi:hypothetical protein
MTFGTRVGAGLTAALVMALAGAQAISAGTVSAGPTGAKATPPGTGAKLVLPARVGSSIKPPAGTYLAKAPPRGTAVPLLVPAGVRWSNRVASTHGLECEPVEGFKSTANDRYVAAELDYGPLKYPRQNLYAMLRARATRVGHGRSTSSAATKLQTVGRSSRPPTADGQPPRSAIRGATDTCFAPKPHRSGHGSSTTSSASSEPMGRSSSTHPQPTDTWQPNWVHG